jgi:hypothetical protein
VLGSVGSLRAAQPSNSAQEKRPSPSAAPGEFPIDEEAAERALERTLIQRGALLLPVGQMEIEPGFAYTRTELDVAGEVFAVGSQVIGSTEKLRRDIVDVDVQVRLGMAFDSQLELRLPYRYVSQSRVTQVGSSFLSEEDEDASAFGDFRVGLAKTLLRERRWWPDLVARVAWDSDTGDVRDGDVLLGGGFNEIIGTLSAVKRQDPLAFIGAVSFQHTYENEDIEPGQQIRFLIGVALAASPETSLRAIIDQTFVDEIKIADRVVSGSDQTVGVLSLGASLLIGRSTLLDVSTDIGLTNEAPDYSVRISIGQRFTLF